jgi:hypothetical protein
MDERNRQFAWARIQTPEVAKWNENLFRTDAPYLQYPYWIEALSGAILRPQYFCCYSPDGLPVAYAAVLSIGCPGLRIGILNGGPVNLVADRPLPDEVFAAFWRCLRSSGFFCVRFSNTPESIWGQMSGSCVCETRDPFPWYSSSDHCVVVDQLETDTETLAAFKKHARQEIKKAAALGYDIESTASPETIRIAWQVVEAMERRKGRRIYRRRADSYERLVALAGPYARIFLTRLGQRLVQAILLVRDRDAAHYIVGAVDVAALGDQISPACLTHWKAMRDFHLEGARSYDLGNDNPELHGFKSKFSPRRIEYRPSATAILRPAIYRIWKGTCDVLQSVSGLRRLPVLIRERLRAHPEP